MFKKIAYALALAGLASGQAYAITANTGFEAGNTSGWVTPLGTLQATTGTTVQLIDDGFEVAAPIPVALTPQVDSYFGLLSLPCSNPADVNTCSSSLGFTINLGGPVSNYGDLMWVRFMTPDFRDDNAPAAYNDYVSVSYFGVSSPTALNTDTISVDSLWTEDLDQDGFADNNAYDSGWRGFAVPVGTNSITVNLANGPAGDLYNRPFAALDYYAAPVPEADSVAMMLAGLGVLGLVSRRRSVKAK